MADFEKTRVRYLLGLWQSGLGTKVVSLIWTIYGIFSAWRQEFLSEQEQNAYLVLRLIPHLSLAWWCAIGAAIVSAWVFESSFQLWNTPAFATKADIRLRFAGDDGQPQTTPTEIRSENVPFWYAVFSPSASLTHPETGTPFFIVPTHWSVFLVFERPTRFKEVVARFHTEIGHPPQVIVMYQHQRFVVLSLTNLVYPGELDVYVKA